MALPADLIQSLSSADASQALRSLRAVKNAVIGNRRQKALYVGLGAVPVLADLLRAGGPSSILAQAVVALGSLAALEEGCTAALQHGCAPLLLDTLLSEDAALAQASVLALSGLYRVRLA